MEWDPNEGYQVKWGYDEVETEILEQDGVYGMADLDAVEHSGYAQRQQDVLHDLREHDWGLHDQVPIVVDAVVVGSVVEVWRVIDNHFNPKIIFVFFRSE